MKKVQKMASVAAATALVTTALVPVASAATPTASVNVLQDVVLEIEGKTVKLDYETFKALKRAENQDALNAKIVNIVTSEGVAYSYEEFKKVKRSVDHDLEKTAQILEEKVEKEDITDIPDGKVVDGKIVADDDQTSEPTVQVESVKAINTTGVTVTIAELQEDVEGATIEVKDPAGNVLSVVAQNLNKGTTEVTFPFTVVPEKIAAGTWTVDGQSFEIVSNDASFANLVSNIGTWDQPFNPTAETQPTYEVLVDADAKAVDFTPTAAEGTTITMSYTADEKSINSVVQNGKANAVTLGKEAAVAGQTVTFTVIAPDQKTSATYKVKIVQAAANANDDATLSTLTVKDNVDKGIITFDKTKDSYSAIVPFATNEVTVTPKVSEDKATVYIDGKKVTSEEATPVNLAVGQNKIEVKVVAEDNKTEKVYTINVERTEEGAASVNTLNSLTLSDGTLEDFEADKPTGDNDTVELTTKVGNKVEDLTITPIATHGKAKIEVTAANDLEVVQDGASYTIKGLKEGANNKVTITVTPANGGEAQEYELTVERAKATASDIAQLSTFKAVYETSTNLFGTDDFKPTTEEYSYNVKNGVDKLELETKLATGNNGVVYVNGTKVEDQDGKTPVDLKIGENIIKVKVVAEDAVTERTYTLKVNRASSTASEVATLNDIVLSDNAKLEGFTADDADKKTASTTVGSDVNELTITPKATDAKANVTVTAEGENLEVVKNGGSYTIKGLKAGKNEVKISVQAENVEASVEYTLTINKVAVSASDNAFLDEAEGIKLTALSEDGNTATAIPNFKKDKYDYTAPVAFDKVSTNLEFKVAEDAKVTVNGKSATVQTDGAVGEVKVEDLPLKVGDNKFTIVVTAADGKTTKTYTVNVKRAAETASDVATLNKLDVSAGTLEGFTADEGVVSDGSPTNNTLSVKVANDVKDLTLTPKATEAGATIEVTAKDKEDKDLEVVASNGAYTVKGLTEGANTVTVKVTAADGVSTEEYEVTITRVGAGADNNAKLADDALTVTNPTEGVELKATNDDKTEYVAYVANGVEKVEFTATVVEGQSVLYDGEVLELESQAATIAADLVPGQANEVKFTVLAADQKTTVDYKVIVHRAAADASADATLKAIESVSPGEIKDFDPTKEEQKYDVIVPADTKVFKFKPVANEENARIEVEGVADATVTKNADGTYSVNFATDLTTDGTAVKVKVTAADNSSTKEYTLTVKVTE